MMNFLIQGNDHLDAINRLGTINKQENVPVQGETETLTNKNLNIQDK